jgi:hypothetical protein
MLGLLIPDDVRSSFMLVETDSPAKTHRRDSN